MTRRKKDPRKHKYVLVDANGWEGLYVDGKCVEQYHDVDLIAWLRKYGLDISFKEAYDDPQVREEGTLPAKLKDIEFD